ncbi:MAG: tetratricopeptide repeat protein, partial [Tepidisphaeraceae bacterium]
MPGQMTLQQQLESGVSHHQAGRLAEAERIYRQILAQQPDHADALRLLGVLAGQAGQVDAGMELIRRAIRLKPDLAVAHSNLGNALKDKGQLDEAIASYREAIRLKPDFVEAHNNLGNALRNKGQLDEAIACYRQAIRTKPGYAVAYSNLGIALVDSGQLGEAIASHRQAIRFKPDSAEVHVNLGNALRANGHLDEASASYRQAIRLKPDYALAHSNLGNALKDKGQLDEAIAAYQQAIRLKPDYAEAHSNLGNALMDAGRLDEAIASHRQAIRLKPDFAEAHFNLGNELKDVGQLDEAIACYRQAIRLKPDDARVHGNLVFGLHYHPGYDGRMIREELRRWNRQHAEPLKKFIQPHSNNRDPARRLRIGYVSPDLRDHVVGQNLLPLLREHDHGQMEIVCYGNVLQPDAITDQLRRHADVWRNIVRLSDSQVADLIRQEQIDILVDLSLHTLNNRLLHGGDGLPAFRSLFGSIGFGCGGQALHFVALHRADDSAAGNVLVLRRLGPDSRSIAAADRDGGTCHVRLPEQFRESLARARSVGGDSAGLAGVAADRSFASGSAFGYGAEAICRQGHFAGSAGVPEPAAVAGIRADVRPDRHRSGSVPLGRGNHDLRCVVDGRAGGESCRPDGRRARRRQHPEQRRRAGTHRPNAGTVRADRDGPGQGFAAAGRAA